MCRRLSCLQGQEGFRGLQLCARDLTTDRLADLAGKRVVVLGCGKSAVDACAAAAEVAASTTMLFRKAGQPCMRPVQAQPNGRPARI